MPEFPEECNFLSRTSAKTIGKFLPSAFIRIIFTVLFNLQYFRASTNRITVMSDSDKKFQSLKQHGSLNPRPEKVKHKLFDEKEFFDPHDLVQVKYEMLRSVRHDYQSISQAAKDFGLSRVSFYQAENSFEQHGLVGLSPQKRGPKTPHKLTEEVMSYIEQTMNDDHTLDPVLISRMVEKKFAKTIHPRTIEKALEGKQKKGRQR
jgi:transposase